jgi:dolichol-phosphate mannosyltransferase
MTTPTLAIVMPVFNESQGLEETLRSWITGVLDRVPGSIIIAVDDGSTDGSGPLLDTMAGRDPRLRPLHQRNQGYGGAILTGYRAALDAGAPWIFQTDSDGQYVPAQFDDFWERRDGAWVVAGRRTNRTDSALRRLGAAVERQLVQAMFGMKLADPNAGIRLMRAEALAAALNQIAAGDVSPNMEIAIIARRLYRERFEEIPVQCRPRVHGKSSLGSASYLWAGLRTLADLARLRRRLLSGPVSRREESPGR